MLRVRAHNQAGAGPYSQISTFKTGNVIPSEPGTPFEAGGNAETLLVAWESPSHDGGSEILSCSIQMREGGVPAQPMLNFINLTCHRHCSGMKEILVEPFLPLEQVHLKGVVAGWKTRLGPSKEFTCMWSCTGSGNSCQASFEDVMTVEGEVNRATLSGLRPAQSYQIRVCATNREGTSGYSRIGEATAGVRLSPCLLPPSYSQS